MFNQRRKDFMLQQTYILRSTNSFFTRIATGVKIVRNQLAADQLVNYDD